MMHGLCLKTARVVTARCRSHTGARINIPDSDAIPENFVLLVAANGSPRRRCRVMWRKPHELGVKFETRLDDRIRAAAVPNPGDDATAKKEIEPVENGA